MSERILEFSGFVRLILEALDNAGVPYMIGGAVAAWAWGEPRATIDLDLVADIHIETVPQLSKELSDRGVLVPPKVILNAILEERGNIAINAIHSQSGFKVDLYPLRPNDELRQSAFQRRKIVDLGPLLGEVYLHSPEDLILYKLWYYGLSRQTKHLRDITAIVLTLGSQIDYQYISSWTIRKGLDTLWKELLVNIEAKDDSR